MGGIRQTASGLRRLPLLVWVGASAVVLIGLTGAFGGFAPALDHGRVARPGEEILLQRWHVHVDDAALVDDSLEGQEPDPRIRLTVRLEFLGTESECCLTDGMLEARYAGVVTDGPWAVYEELRSSNQDFDPDVPTTRVLDFPLDGPDVPPSAPETVDVVVRDERPSSSPLWATWIPSAAVATVELPVSDLRRRR